MNKSGSPAPKNDRSASGNAVQREQLYRLTNRVFQSPGDIDALREYVSFFLPDTDTSESSDVLEACDQIETFLVQRAREIEASKLSSLLEIAEMLDERREQALQRMESSIDESGLEVDADVAQSAKAWREEGINDAIPSDPSEARAKLDRCTDVQAFIRSREEEPIDGLNRLINRLQRAAEIDDLLARASSLLDGAEEEDNVTEAAYILQSAEQVVRQLISQRSEVGAPRKERIEGVIRELETASEKISRRKRDAQDAQVWSRFQKEHGVLLEDVKALDPSKVEVSFSLERKATKRWKKTPEEPVISHQIQRVERLLQRLDQTLAQVQGSSMREIVQHELEVVSGKHDALQKQRHQNYNAFAMERLQGGFAKAQDDGVGLWNDKEEIANVLVDYLAEIDQRYLTSEVGRCYSEVFETLYGKLKKAKGEDDFEEEGRKLNALKRMYETEPILPEHF